MLVDGRHRHRQPLEAGVATQLAEGIIGAGRIAMRLQRQCLVDALLEIGGQPTCHFQRDGGRAGIRLGRGVRRLERSTEWCQQQEQGDDHWTHGQARFLAGRGAGSRRHHHDPHSQIGKAGLGFKGETRGGPGLGIGQVERPATADALAACSWSVRIAGFAMRIRAVPVSAPLQGIAAQIEQALQALASLVPTACNPGLGEELVQAWAASSCSLGVALARQAYSHSASLGRRTTQPPKKGIRAWQQVMASDQVTWVWGRFGSVEAW